MARKSAEGQGAAAHHGAPRRPPFVRPSHGSGTLPQLRATLWYAIARLNWVMHDQALPDDEIRKTAHALSQLAGTYTRLVETAELAAQVEALTHEVQRMKEGRP